MIHNRGGAEHMDYVIIGNSAAGVNAVEAIRQVDRKGRIVNISSESYPPYSRPLLSYLIAGKVTEERMNFRPLSFYSDYDVTPILGHEVVDVDCRNQLVLTSGRRKRIRYDKLLIATGRSPGKLNIRGLEGQYVYSLTTLDEAKGILRVLPEMKRAVVIGSGLIGLKAAEALTIIGREVSVIEIGDQLLPLATDRRASEILASVFEKQGVRIHLNDTVAEVRRHGSGKVKEVLLRSGESVSADLVIVAAGLIPNFRFLLDTQTRVNIGVIVDHHLETTQENVYAAGDVSESKDIITGRSNLSAVWPRASEQGYCAGFNMAGFKKEYLGGYGMNSVAFFGLSCITVGDVLTESDGFEVMVKEIPDENVYFKVILDEDVVRGAVLVGRILNVSAMNKLLRKRVNVRPFKENLLEEKFVFAY